MSEQLLWWTFFGGLLGSLVMSTLSYSLRSLSRVALEEALGERRRRDLERILEIRHDVALTASTLRLAANVTAIVAVTSYFLIRHYNDPHPAKIFGWSLLIAVPGLLIFSVAVPQAWAKYAGERLLAVSWPILRLAHGLLWPAVRVLKVFDEIVRRLAGVSIGEDPDDAAEAEILSVVAEGTAGGTVDKEQQKMIEGVISFRDLQVGQIMTPRTEVVAVEVNTPVLDVRDRILRDGLSRVPVYEGTLDNVVGILYAKDLLPFLQIGADTAPGASADRKLEIRWIMRPPLFVPRTKLLRDLLRELRAAQVHMAVVLDEYGGTSGLVTTEDIVEQIVGDIADEYERPEEAELHRIDDRTVEVDARMPVIELNRALELSLPEDGDYQTIGGYVLTILGAIPAKGERFSADGVTVFVLDAEPRRVKKLRIELPAPEAVAASDETSELGTAA